MGALAGLGFGIGMLIVFATLAQGPHERSAVSSGPLQRLAQQSGIAQLTGARLLTACVSLAVVCASFVLIATAIPVAALIAGGASGLLPIAAVKRQARIRQRALRKAWPDAVDVLLSAVRAGKSLPESVCELADRGPQLLRPAFAELASTYRLTGSFESSLMTLVEQLTDPVADRVTSALLVAHDVGGHDLGTVLRTLSAFLREDARVRDELEARQSWTVNAARLGVAAPWITLALLSTRPEALLAYRSAQGAFVLLLAAALSLLAYRMMRWIGRLPEESRLVRT